VRPRALIAFLVCLVAALVLAAPAMAGNNGEGLAGETDDKVVTFFSLGVIVFFVLVVVLGTIAQSALERRKEEKKAAALRQRTGW
jgi:CDP-diglyceride synthetase